MTCKHFSHQQRAITYALALTLVNFISCSTQVLAQPANRFSNVLTRGQINFTPPTPPPSTGTAGDTQSAGTRSPAGSCPVVDTPLTALVSSSKTQEGDSFVWGKTVAEYPTFWFYLPYLLTPELPVNFMLEVENGTDENGDPARQIVYETTFTLTGILPGVASFSLPSTVNPLEIGKTYYWSVAIICDPSDHSADKFVKGVIQRFELEPTLTSQLEKATPKERAALYATEGIWYDALTTLAELRRSAPQDVLLAKDWADLLEAVSLDQISQKPLAQCCTLEQAIK